MFEVDWEKEDYPSGGISIFGTYQMLKKRNLLLYHALEQRGQLDDLCKALWIEINSHYVMVLKEVELMYPRQEHETFMQRWQNNERLISMSKEINNQWVDQLEVWQYQHWTDYVRFDENEK